MIRRFAPDAARERAIRQKAIPLTVLACAAILSGFLSGCPSGPGPADPGPCSASANGPEAAPTAPTPLEILVAELTGVGRKGPRAPAGRVLELIKTAAQDDPEQLLLALGDSGVVLLNHQAMPSREELERFNEKPAVGSDFPIFQKLLLDGGDVVFYVIYSHRMGKSGVFDAGPGGGKESSHGDLVSMKTRMVHAAFLPCARLLDLDAGLARLSSPDWRVALTAADAMMAGVDDQTGRLRLKGLELLASSAQADESRAAVLKMSGMGDRLSPAVGAGLALAKRAGAMYLAWFKGEDAAESGWRSALKALESLADDQSIPAGERLEALASALVVFGHGSDLPGIAAGQTGERPYVKVMSPLIEAWLVRMLAAEPPSGAIAGAALAEGADPYLKLKFIENRRQQFFRGIASGLASTDPYFRLRCLKALESATASVYPEFDPFAPEADRAAAMRDVEARVKKNTGRSPEERERRLRAGTAVKSLEAAAIVVRREREARGHFPGDVVEAFGSDEAAASAGFTRDERGRVTGRNGFVFSLESRDDWFRVALSGPLSDGDAETVFRLDSRVGAVEMIGAR